MKRKRTVTLEALADSHFTWLGRDKLLDIVHSRKAGVSVKDLALRLGCSESAVRRAPARLAAMAAEDMRRRTEPQQQELPLYDGDRARVQAALTPPALTDQSIEEVGEFVRRLREPEAKDKAVPEREPEPGPASEPVPERKETVMPCLDMAWMRLTGATVPKIAARYRLRTDTVAAQLRGVWIACLTPGSAIPPQLRHEFMTACAGADPCIPEDILMLYRRRGLEPAPQPKPMEKAKRNMIYGKNVTIRHKHVTGITATVYVEVGGLTQPPEMEWWLKAAAAKLGLVFETSNDQAANDWLLVGVQ